MDSFGSTSQPINIGDQDTNPSPSTPLSRRPPTNPRSDMFVRYFTKFFDADGVVIRAKCNFCEKSYAFKHGSGYGTLNKHLEKTHPQEMGIQRSQTQLTGFAQQGSSSSSSLNLFKFSDLNWRDGLARFVCTQHLPFTFGEKQDFVRLVQENANPQVKRVPRTTLTRDIRKIYKKEKNNLSDYFLKLDSLVSICSDIWSDHWQINSYMGITCHWVDSNWFLQKRIIAFRVFNDSHTAQNISRIISVILHEYNLTDKIFSIGFDNATANTASIVELKNICGPIIGGKFFHIRCVCHILNLSVQSGLSALESYIKPIKEGIKYLTGHPSLMKQWGKYCVQNGQKPKRFKKDVPNRWNSTYDLLSDSSKYSTLLCNFFTDNSCLGIVLLPTHWNSCLKLLQVLKVFKDATCIFSRVYYPTSHLFLVEACNIVGVLRSHMNDETLMQSIISMLAKWINYYKEIPLLYLVAIVLDPRFKFKGLEQYLKLYYSMLKDCFPYNPEIISIDASKYINETKNIINALYDEYSVNFRNQVPTSSTISTGTSHDFSTTSFGSSNFIPPGLEMFQSLKKHKGTTSTELEEYLTTSFDFSDNKLESDSVENFKVLEWWKKKTTMCPVISLIAKEILAAPTSTVAVEQAFSQGGNILDETRSRLSHESLEIQALVDDWSKAARREQEQDIEEDFDLDATTTDGSSTCTSSSPITDAERANNEDDDDDNY